jgi:hypothetical protein
MTKLPPGKLWVISRKTKLESGRHDADAVDIDGVPTRLCTVVVPPGMHKFTADDANAHEEEKEK